MELIDCLVDGEMEQNDQRSGFWNIAFAPFTTACVLERIPVLAILVVGWI